ncbi:PEP-CTERM sorting domain-containing protein, partial [Myxococcota bacterium]|nr:PEP-CTERM sorting domain-containing protein [Myxococcota bacterium]
ENLLAPAMAPSSQEMEPPAIPGRFTVLPARAVTVSYLDTNHRIDGDSSVIAGDPNGPQCENQCGRVKSALREGADRSFNEFVELDVDDYDALTRSEALGRFSANQVSELRDAGLSSMGLIASRVEIIGSSGWGNSKGSASFFTRFVVDEAAQLYLDASVLCQTAAGQRCLSAVQLEAGNGGKLVDLQIGDGERQGSFEFALEPGVTYAVSGLVEIDVAGASPGFFDASGRYSIDLGFLPGDSPPIPEPTTGVLLGLGIGMLAGQRRRPRASLRSAPSPASS